MQTRVEPRTDHESLLHRLVLEPSEFCRRLQQMGPVYVKIGQFFALHPDLVAPEYLEELLQLQDRAQPFSWQEAESIVTEDLARKPDEVFADIDPDPIWSGALAQTYVARLHDGTEVTVKIQRPDIRASVIQDLRRTRLFIRLLDLSPVLPIASLQELLQEGADWLLQELDFSQELANMTQFHTLAVQSLSQRVPKPYPTLSSERILTAERLQGESIDDILSELSANNTNGAKPGDTAAFDNHQIARNLLSSFLEQVFRNRLFQANMHPDYSLAFAEDQVGFVDFGLVVQVDETIRTREIQFLSAVFNSDIRQMLTSLTEEIAIPGEQTDSEAFRRDFLNELQRWIDKGRNSGSDDSAPRRSTDGLAITQILIEFMRIARRHQMQIPPTVLSLYRSLILVEMVARRLDPQADLRTTGQRFFSTLQIEDALFMLKRPNIQSVFLSFLTLLRDSPSQLHQILSELAGNNFALTVYSSEAPQTAHANDRRVRLLTASILSVGIALLLAAPELPQPFGISLTRPLFGILGLLYIWIIVQWWRLR